MFCPNCGDCRGNVYKLIFHDKNTRFNSSYTDKFRCPICGHVFKYEVMPLLEKQFGEGNGYFCGEDNVI